MWWNEDAGEPPYVGTPLDEDWDGYDELGHFTHFTRIVNPVFPRPPAPHATPTAGDRAHGSETNGLNRRKRK